MLTVIFVLIGLVPILLVIGVFVFVYWLSADFKDGRVEDGRLKEHRPFFRRLFRWLNKPTKRLDYRRDKLGRFRKVRRG